MKLEPGSGLDSVSRLGSVSSLDALSSLDNNSKVYMSAIFTLLVPDTVRGFVFVETWYEAGAGK